MISKKSLAAALLGTLSAGCGLTATSAPVYYTPDAYYQTVGGVYECYYVSSAAEAYALENAGLCPTYAIPTQMPLSWEEMYWDYYSGPAYYNTYIPSAYRRTYVSVTCVHFHQTYSSNITRLSNTAVYRSSSGGTVRGSSSVTTFTSGTRKTVTYSVPRSPSRVYSSGRH